MIRRVQLGKSDKDLIVLWNIRSTSKIEFDKGSSTRNKSYQVRQKEGFGRTRVREKLIRRV